MRLRFAFALTFLCATPAQAADVDLARRAFKDGDHRKALELAQKALAKDPYSLEAINIAAMAATRGYRMRAVVPTGCGTALPPTSSPDWISTTPNCESLSRQVLTISR